MALVADRIGRRKVLLFTILAYTLLTGATAFSPNAFMFVVFQFFARTFAVAESLLAVVVIAEEFDPEVRGWGIGAFAAIQSTGAGLAALLFALVGHLEHGWRGTVSGRTWAAATACLLATDFAGNGAVRSPPRATCTQSRKYTTTHRSADPYVSRTAFLLSTTVLFVVAIAESAANFFGPKYLQDVHGWTPGAVGLMTFGAGAFAILGNTFAGWLSDRVGRKKVTIGFLIGQVVFTIAYYNVPALFVIPSWVLMVFTLLGVNVVLAAYGAELFPHLVPINGCRRTGYYRHSGWKYRPDARIGLYGVYQSHWPAIFNPRGVYAFLRRF